MAYLCRALQEPPKVCLCLWGLLLWFCDELCPWVGEVGFTLSGADVGKDDGVVWIDVACTFRMLGTGEAAGRPVDE